MQQLGSDYEHIYRTSAKTGDDVEVAMTELSQLIIRNDLNAE